MEGLESEHLDLDNDNAPSTIEAASQVGYSGKALELARLDGGILPYLHSSTSENAHAFRGKAVEPAPSCPST